MYKHSEIDWFTVDNIRITFDKRCHFHHLLGASSFHCLGSRLIIWSGGTPNLTLLFTLLCFVLLIKLDYSSISRKITLPHIYVGLIHPSDLGVLMQWYIFFIRINLLIYIYCSKVLWVMLNHTSLIHKNTAKFAGPYLENKIKFSTQ